MSFSSSPESFQPPNTIEVSPDTVEGLAEINISAEDLYTNEIAPIVEQAERDYEAGISYFPAGYFDASNGVHEAVKEFNKKYEAVNDVLSEIKVKIEEGKTPVTEDDVDKIEQVYGALQQARDEVREQFASGNTTVEAASKASEDIWGDVRDELDQASTEVAAELANQTSEEGPMSLDVEADMALNESLVPTAFEREFAKVSVIENTADALTERLLSLHIDGSSQPDEVVIYINELHEISTYASKLALKHSGFTDTVSEADKRAVETFVGKAQSQLVDLESACQLLEGSAQPVFSEISESNEADPSGPLQLTPDMRVENDAGQKRLDELRAVADQPVEQVKVFGMSIPAVGPAGIFGARSFREALKIQQYSYPENSKLRQVVTEMINEISVVPDAGITQEQKARLLALSQQLQSPQVESSGVTLKRKTLEPVDLSHPEASVPISQPSVEAPDQVDESTPIVESVTIADKTAPIPKTEYEAINVAWEDDVSDESEVKQPAVAKQVSVKSQTVPKEPVESSVAESTPKPEVPPIESASRSWFGRKNESFESLLEREIEAIESPAVSRLDAMFGDTKSAYEVLGEVSFSEIQDWSELSHYALKAELDQPGVNLTYEMFDQWLQRMPEMQDMVPEAEDLTFKEVVDLYVERTIRNYS